MENTLYEFQLEMGKSGLLAECILPDAKLHRCGTTDKPRSKNGWYCLFPDDPASGVFGDWRTGSTVKWTSKNGDQTSVDRALFKKRLDEAQRSRRNEEGKRQEAARERARKILDRCKAARPDHPYLVKKQVKALGDIRAMKNLLVLPVIDETGAVSSLQFVSPDGTKRFLSGGKVHVDIFQ